MYNEQILLLGLGPQFPSYGTVSVIKLRIMFLSWLSISNHITVSVLKFQILLLYLDHQILTETTFQIPDSVVQSTKQTTLMQKTDQKIVN